MSTTAPLCRGMMKESLGKDINSAADFVMTLLKIGHETCGYWPKILSDGTITLLGHVSYNSGEICAYESTCKSPC